jgi:superfamily II DNA helicase RecQ
LIEITAFTIFEKLQLFKANKYGFDSTLYLQTKANASIDFEYDKVIRKTKKDTQKSTNSVKSYNTGLYEIIKNWRDGMAEELGLEGYMVLPQKTMKSISTEKPGNMTALAQINGLGKAKLTQFGERILEMVNEYCVENNLAPYLVEKGKKIEKTIEKGSTFETTLNLHKEGKSIQEIAEIRSMTLWHY